MFTKWIAWSVSFLAVCGMAGCTRDRSLAFQDCADGSCGTPQRIVKGSISQGSSNPGYVPYFMASPVIESPKYALPKVETAPDPVVLVSLEKPAEPTSPPPVRLDVRKSEVTSPARETKVEAKAPSALPLRAETKLVPMPQVETLNAGITEIKRDMAVGTLDLSQSLVGATRKTVEAGKENSACGQKDHFKCVWGEVVQWRRTLRLRYAPIDAEDAFGGFVILDGPEANKLHEGQHVRVQGTLVPPTSRLEHAHYVVQTIEPLD